MQPRDPETTHTRRDRALLSPVANPEKILRDARREDATAAASFATARTTLEQATHNDDDDVADATDLFSRMMRQTPLDDVEELPAAIRDIEEEENQEDEEDQGGLRYDAGTTVEGPAKPITTEVDRDTTATGPAGEDDAIATADILNRTQVQTWVDERMNVLPRTVNETINDAVEATFMEALSDVLTAPDHTEHRHDLFKILRLVLSDVIDSGRIQTAIRRTATEAVMEPSAIRALSTELTDTFLTTPNVMKSIVDHVQVQANEAVTNALIHAQQDIALTARERDAIRDEMPTRSGPPSKGQKARTQGAPGDDPGNDSDAESVRSGSTRSGRKATKAKRSARDKAIKKEDGGSSSDWDAPGRRGQDQSEGSTSGEDAIGRKKVVGRTDPPLTLTPLRPVNTHFRRALDYRTYLLNDRSTKFNSGVTKQIAKMVRRMDVQMKSQIFDPVDPITILSFLPAFKTACDSNGIHEGAAMWLFQYFVKKTTKAAIVARTTAGSTGDGKTPGSHLTNYPAVVQFLLKTYATDEVIAEADAEINRYRQPDRMSPPDYAHNLWTKALRCGTVYDEDRLKGIFIEGLHESICQSVRNYWSKNGDADLQELARHAKSMANIRGDKATQPPTNDRAQRARRDNRATPALLVADDRDASSSSAGPSNSTQSDATDPEYILLMQRAMSHFASSTSDDASSAAMDSGADCRICFADRSDHVTSACPYLRNVKDFVQRRNANFLRKRGGRRNFGRGRNSGGGNGGNGGGNTGNANQQGASTRQGSQTPSTQASETGKRTGPPPGGNAGAQSSKND